MIDQPIHLSELAPELADAGLYFRVVEHYDLWTDSIDAAILFMDRYECDVVPQVILVLSRMRSANLCAERSPLIMEPVLGRHKGGIPRIPSNYSSWKCTRRSLPRLRTKTARFQDPPDRSYEEGVERYIGDGRWMLVG